MRFYVEIDCDSAAFKGVSHKGELVQILSQLASNISARETDKPPRIPTKFRISDCSGNAVGVYGWHFPIKEED